MSADNILNPRYIVYISVREKWLEVAKLCGFMSARSRRCRANIKPAASECLVFIGCSLRKVDHLMARALYSHLAGIFTYSTPLTLSLLKFIFHLFGAEIARAISSFKWMKNNDFVAILWIILHSKIMHICNIRKCEKVLVK